MSDCSRSGYSDDNMSYFDTRQSAEVLAASFGHKYGYSPDPSEPVYPDLVNTGLDNGIAHDAASEGLRILSEGHCEP